jgi:methylmalonyl-CoA/ethylmalonyl-CoA epimerase
VANQLIKGIDHIGIAVNNLNETLAAYEKVLGLKPEKVMVMETLKAKIAFIKVGESKLELFEPLSKESTIAKFLEKRGEGIQHIALRVTGIDDMLNALKNKGVALIDEKPRIGAEGGKIAFIHPQNLKSVLVEFVEK